MKTKKILHKLLAFTFFTTLFTVLTGLTYLYENRTAIQAFINQDESQV